MSLRVSRGDAFAQDVSAKMAVKADVVKYIIVYKGYNGSDSNCTKALLICLQ